MAFLFTKKFLIGGIALASAMAIAWGSQVSSTTLKPPVDESDRQQLGGGHWAWAIANNRTGHPLLSGTGIPISAATP